MSDDETKEAEETTEETPAAEPEAADGQAETAAGQAEAESEGEEKEFVFVEDPTFDIDYKGDCAYEVKVSIPATNEVKLSDEVFEELRHEAEVPGFRRGRAPRKLIEKKFFKAVRNDVEARLVQSAFTKLMKDKDLNPMAPPEADEFSKPEDRKPEDPITFRLKFEVQPRVELGKYRGVEVERPTYAVQDKDVDETLSSMQARFGVYETLADGKAADGDQAIIDFRGMIDGEEFQGGSAENYPYILGSKRFFPEFEQVLVGAQPGASLSCEVTFPDSYSAEHLRGRTAVFEIKVNELKRRVTPELTDEFAQQAGYDNVQDMREKVKARLQANSAGHSDSVAESRVLKAMIDASTFEVPKSLIDHMASEVYEDRVKELRDQRVPASAIEQREEALRAEARKQALESIQTFTALNEIAEVEGIEVTDEDFEKEATSMSARTGYPVEATMKYLGDEENRSKHETRIRHAKTLTALVSYATITDKEVPPEELVDEDEDGAPAAGAEDDV